MTFNTALSGLKAAANDLKITGSNIANASTVGYKQSRAEFSDVYAASILGAGSQQMDLALSANVDSVSIRPDRSVVLNLAGIGPVALLDVEEIL